MGGLVRPAFGVRVASQPLIRRKSDFTPYRKFSGLFSVRIHTPGSRTTRPVKKDDFDACSLRRGGSLRSEARVSAASAVFCQRLSAAHSLSRGKTCVVLRAG